MPPFQSSVCECRKQYDLAAEKSAWHFWKPLRSSAAQIFRKIEQVIDSGGVLKFSAPKVIS
jgi:hypothetical protein